MSLHLIPVSLAEAKAFIEVFHRHLPPPRGHKFSLGATDTTGMLVAVAVVGRPVGRGLDDGRTLEVTRLPYASSTSFPRIRCSRRGHAARRCRPVPHGNQSAAPSPRVRGRFAIPAESEPACPPGSYRRGASGNATRCRTGACSEVMPL